MKRLFTIIILLIILVGCNKEVEDVVDETIIEDMIPDDGIKDEVIPDTNLPDNEESDDDVVEVLPDEETKPPNVSYEEFKKAIDFLDRESKSFKTYNLLIGGSYTYKSNSYISSYLFDDLKYTKDYIKSNTKARPGNKRNVKWIVIHETGNTSQTADALNHSKYIKNLAIENKQSISWHYTVDMKDIISHIPDNEIAYHAGDGLRDVGVGNYLGGGNKNGIGIEMCVNKTNDILLTYKKTAKLVANLMVKHNLELSDVKKHFDFSGKNCPQSIIHNGLWDEFLDYVDAEYLYLTTMNNFTFEIIEKTNVDKYGKILGSKYDYKIKIVNTLTNNHYIYEKKS